MKTFISGLLQIMQIKGLQSKNVVVVVVLNKAYYVPKNSLCGLINIISIQFHFLSSLLMSLCKKVRTLLMDHNPVTSQHKLKMKYYLFFGYHYKINNIL